MSEAYDILGITVEQIEDLTEHECKQIVMSGTGLDDETPKGRILTREAFEGEQVNYRMNFYYEEGLPRTGTSIRFGLYKDNLRKGSQRSDNQTADDLVVAIFSFLEDKVVANLPMVSDFNYFKPITYFGSRNRAYRRDYEMGTDKITYSYKEFLFLLMSLDNIRNLGASRDTSTVLVDFFRPLLQIPFLERDLGLLNFNENHNNVSELTFLTFTHSIKKLEGSETLYRLKFGAEDTPTFAFKYERDGVEGFGYRMKGTFLIDIVFDGDVVTAITLYRYDKPLTVFNEYTVIEDEKERVDVLTIYLQKYIGKTYKELREIEMVTDLRQNGLQEIANTEQGRVLRQYLKLNVG